MTPVSPPRKRPVGAVLNEAMLATGITKRGLAKMLAGPNADERTVERRRRQIQKWLALDDGHWLKTANASRLADLLDIDPALLTKPQLSPQEKQIQEIRRLEEQAQRLRRDLGYGPQQPLPDV